jgi:sterol desaturase/sphingolipid hydroxylase (fatty acid hydroxylase superfamily)
VGVIPLIFFIVLQPLSDRIDEALRLQGFIPLNLDRVIPGFADRPVLTFVGYLVILDFAAYWQHRLQHRLEWWWALHALHHSQTRMSLWTDDRNHLLDDVIGSLWFSAIALLIGVPPAQFLFLALLTRFVQSLAHANISASFGAIGDRLLVSPRFHRVHHGVGVGHAGDRWGCNFAVLFPVWDILFGSARFDRAPGPTGIDDQALGVNYGASFWEQQWLGLKRLWRSVAI